MPQKRLEQTRAMKWLTTKFRFRGISLSFLWRCRMPCVKSKICEMKEMSPLEEIRHSAAHVLATAVLRLYPNTKLDIGPPTDQAFYYDFDSDIPFTPEIIEEIEAEMKKVIKENQRFERLGSFP